MSDKSGVESRSEDDLRETVKMQFDFFKHLATLSIATAVIILAVYRDGLMSSSVEPLKITVALVLSLVLLSVSLITALGGMTQMMTILIAEKPERLPIPKRVEKMYKLAVLNGAQFVSGVGMFVLVVLGF